MRGVRRRKRELYRLVISSDEMNYSLQYLLYFAL